MPETENAIAPATFDLDAWIDGTCGLTRIAKVYRRGDLLAKLDELERRLEAAKTVDNKDRGVTDDGFDELIAEYETVAEEFTASALTMHVQDRTDGRRRKIRDRLIKEVKLDPKTDDDSETIYLHQLADAIVKVETPDGAAQEFPDGFPVNKLREIKDRLGDTGIFELMEAFRKVTMEAPSVAAPLSRRSSSARGGIT